MSDDSSHADAAITDACLAVLLLPSLPAPEHVEARRRAVAVWKRELEAARRDGLVTEQEMLMALWMVRRRRLQSARQYEFDPDAPG